MDFTLTLTPEALLFWLVTLGWLVELLVFRPWRGQRDRSGRWSFAIILAALLVSLAVTAGLYHVNLGNLEGGGQLWVRRAALGVYASGVALRLWAASCLGPWFSVWVETPPEQVLVSRGPYRRLRHPLYLGLYLLGVGLSGLHANLPGLLTTAIALLASLDHRMREEERALLEVESLDYRSWRRERYRFLPFIY